MQTRRQFGKNALTGTAAFALAGAVGEVSMGFSCSASTVWADIENYVPLALEAFGEILSLVNPAESTLLTPIITEVKAGLADLEAAINYYINAPAASKATWIGKITTAVNAAIQLLQQFWSDLNLPDGTLATTISNILQIIISTLAAFLPLIGGALAASKRKLSKVIPIVPVSKTQMQKSQFKASINAAFAKGGYSNCIY